MNGTGMYLNFIIFDSTSEIEVIAFRDFDDILKLLKVNIFIMT